MGVGGRITGRNRLCTGWFGEVFRGYEFGARIDG